MLDITSNVLRHVLGFWLHEEGLSSSEHFTTMQTIGLINVRHGYLLTLSEYSSYDESCVVSPDEASGSTWRIEDLEGEE